MPVKHAYQSATPNDGSKEISSTVWNDDHDLSGLVLADISDAAAALALKAPLASPTLVTPVLGVATATSINKVAITAPATAATLTIANNQTLTVNGSATITNGTHSGTNTGDQTTITGNAGTATALATGRTIGGITFDGSANIDPGVVVNSVTTGRALALTDRNRQIQQDHASPQTLSIPAQSSVTWVGPTAIAIIPKGSGVCTLDADTGVTLNGVSGGSVALNRYQVALLVWWASDVWTVSGTSADVA